MPFYIYKRACENVRIENGILGCLSTRPKSNLRKVSNIMSDINTEYGVFWGDNLFNYRDTKKPIIEHLLYENDVICISSKAGVGKSILAKHLICNLTTGHSFLDTYKIPIPQNVLYVQTEGDRAETIERFKNMNIGLSMDRDRLVHINKPGLTLNTNKGLQELIKEAVKPNIKYGVIIIDPLYTTVKGSMSSDEVATDWVRNVRTLKGIFGSGVIVMHHDNKDIYHDGKALIRPDDSVFGSTFWIAFFNQNFKFKKHKGIHYLICGKQRSGKIIDKIDMKLVEPRPLMFVNDDALLNMSNATISRVIREKGRTTAKQIKDEAQVSLATVYRSLEVLQNNNLVNKVVEGGDSYYVWRR